MIRNYHHSLNLRDDIENGYENTSRYFYISLQQRLVMFTTMENFVF